MRRPVLLAAAALVPLGAEAASFETRSGASSTTTYGYRSRSTYSSAWSYGTTDFRDSRFVRPLAPNRCGDAFEVLHGPLSHSCSGR